jgi:EAL domain-containing protein (putative c-di-GMP-specific phosphodiesterase class I)
MVVTGGGRGVPGRPAGRLLGHFARKHVSGLLSALPDVPLGLNVNLSVAGLLLPDTLDRTLGAVRDAGLPAGVLRVEVSENLLAEHIGVVTPALQGLAAAGIAVTFDDVGAGSTSLRHLLSVAADGLKIDRSYVAGMLDGERDRAVAQLLVDFAYGTGARITAEGVETEEQRALLLSMGCTYGQGWLFGRPVPLAELVARG